jgi:GntR family transcriptional repressor for pyruvate dehydrogenase complex
MPLTSLRRSPLVELAVSQLREQVLSGQWPVGGRLPAETELAQRLEVGRSTVREAVRALVHAGLLETRQGADIGALRACLAERDRARGEDARFVEADLAFHRAVVAAAHNPLLAEMFDSFAAVLREALIAIRSDQAVQSPDADAAHARLAAAIEAGDAAAAAQATHDHLDPTAANLRSLIDR